MTRYVVVMMGARLHKRLVDRWPLFGNGVCPLCLPFLPSLQTGQYSTQIFSLAVLLSSLFVFNQMVRNEC